MHDSRLSQLAAALGLDEGGDSPGVLRAPGEGALALALAALDAGEGATVFCPGLGNMAGDAIVP